MAKNRKAKGGYRPPIYSSYVFRDKEPVIDLTRTLFEDVYGRKIDHKMLAEVEQNGGPSTSCMQAWFYGKTMRPNNATVEAAGRALGFERKWVKMKV